MEVFYMSMLKCPNCGQVYNDGNTYYCLRCNIKLKPINQVTKPKNPQLSDVSNKVIGTINPTSPTITCPYCKSTDCKKITNTSKAVHTAIFGIFSLGRNSKQWHCNSCKSDF